MTTATSPSIADLRASAEAASARVTELGARQRATREAAERIRNGNQVARALANGNDAEARRLRATLDELESQVVELEQAERIASEAERAAWKPYADAMLQTLAAEHNLAVGAWSTICTQLIERTRQIKAMAAKFEEMRRRSSWPGVAGLRALPENLKLRRPSDSAANLLWGAFVSLLADSPKE